MSRLATSGPTADGVDGGAESGAGPRSSGNRVQVRHGAATHVGLVREENQDAWLAAAPLFVVADGMGGHDGGDEASRIVIEEFELLATSGYDPCDGEPAVTEALERCQRRLRVFIDEHRAAGDPDFRAGTTAVVALLEEGPTWCPDHAAHGEDPEQDGPRWLLANLGDSRIYGYGEGRLRQLTTDHSLVQELVDAGLIGGDEAAHHPERHVVTRALGATARYDADFLRVPVAEASRMLLCSDGISDLVDDSDIERLLAEEADPQAAAGRLVAAALERGGRDNATAMVVDVVGLSEGAASPQ